MQRSEALPDDTPGAEIVESCEIPREGRFAEVHRSLEQTEARFAV